MPDQVRPALPAPGRRQYVGAASLIFAFLEKSVLPLSFARRRH
jgi:hypothetical protein